MPQRQTEPCCTSAGTRWPQVRGTSYPPNTFSGFVFPSHRHEPGRSSCQAQESEEIGVSTTPVQHTNRTQNPIRQFQGDSNLVSEHSRAGFYPKTVLSRYATEKNCLSWVGNYMQMLSLTLLKYLPLSVCAAGCIRGVLIAAVSWGGAYRPA